MALKQLLEHFIENRHKGSRHSQQSYKTWRAVTYFGTGILIVQSNVNSIATLHSYPLLLSQSTSLFYCYPWNIDRIIHGSCWLHLWLCDTINAGARATINNVHVFFFPLSSILICALSILNVSLVRPFFPSKRLRLVFPKFYRISSIQRS